MDGTADAIRARGEARRDAGTRNMTQGVALLAPIVLATKAAGDFSSGMVDIQQKANLSNRETEKLRDSILGAAKAARKMPEDMRSEEHTSELQSLMRISYAVFCLTKKISKQHTNQTDQ